MDNIFLLPAKLPTLFFNPASRSGLKCAWSATHGVKLSAEFLTAKAHPYQFQTSVNTILAEGWREAAEEADPGELASRAEDFGLDAIPPETLIVTAGVDVQHDRLETTFLGHGAGGVAGSRACGDRGSPGDESKWAELDALLRRTWRHPGGGTLRLDAEVIDSGDGACGRVDPARARAGDGLDALLDDRLPYRGAHALASAARREPSHDRHRPRLAAHGLTSTAHQQNPARQGFVAAHGLA